MHGINLNLIHTLPPPRPNYPKYKCDFILHNVLLLSSLLWFRTEICSIFLLSHFFHVLEKEKSAPNVVRIRCFKMS